MDIEAPTAPAATDEATRNAYNTTFAAMELDWHWDRDTYSRLAPTAMAAPRCVPTCSSTGRTCCVHTVSIA